MPLIAPYGIEAVLEYTNTNTLRLNENKRVPGLGEFYRVYSIAGLDDMDIRTESSFDLPNRDGELAAKALYGGRTLAIRARIVAQNLRRLREMQNAVKFAFRDPNTERQLFFRAESSAFDHFITCRKRQLQWAEEQTNIEFTREFLLTLRASDGRFLTSATTSTVVTSATAMTNLGTYRELPVITILPQVATSLVNPVLTWTGASAGTFTLTGTLTNPRTWIIDTKARTIRTDLGASVDGFLSPGSTWPTLEPGTTTYTLTATSGMAGIAKATFVWRHAWI